LNIFLFLAQKISRQMANSFMTPKTSAEIHQIFVKRKKMASSDFAAEPLDMTALGEKTVEEYLSKAEESTEKQMLEKLAGCNGNHFWTAEEKECLIFFMRRVGNDFDKLHSDYFPHRTQGALKTRYQKILRGEDTPASTPRLRYALRRQQQPLQLALSMKEQPADTALPAVQSARALR